jgi:Domain of unknown function (DUF4760)
VNAEWLSAWAAVLAAIVFVASAIAALVQLRHMRGGNQIVALTECRKTLETPEFRKAQRFVVYELAHRLKDPEELRRISGMTPLVDEYEAISTVANFFESMGAFVKYGIIDERIACDYWSFAILRNWQALAPFIAMARVKVSPGVWVNFEYLAVLAERHERLHQDTYPKGFPRMPLDTSLLDELAAEETKP